MEFGKHILLSLAVVLAVALVEAQGHKLFGGHVGKKDHGPKVTQEQLRQNLTAMANEPSTDVLIQFLSALNSTEAKESLKQLKIQPIAVQQLITKLKGNPQQVTEAKQAIKDQFSPVKLDQYTKKDWKAVEGMIKAIQCYFGRQMAKQALNQEKTETLITGLSALAKHDRSRRFRSIHFTDLVTKLQNNGVQGRKEVIDALTKWIDTADSKTFKKAMKIYMKATMSQMTTIPPPTGQSTPLPTGQSSPLPTGQPSPPPSGQSTPPPSGQSTPPPTGQSSTPPSGQSTPLPSGQSTPPPTGGSSTAKSGGQSTTFRQTTPTITGSSRPPTSPSPATTPQRGPE